MRETVLMWVVVCAVAVPPVIATVVTIISVAGPFDLRAVAALGIAVLAPALAWGASPAEAALPGLTVRDNHILREGQPFAFRGVNRDSLEWGRHNWGGCGGDGHFNPTDFANIRAWNASAVRIPLSQAGWLGRRCDAARYRQTVDRAVGLANDAGMYAILDLHWSDVGGAAPCDAGCLTGQQPMPDSDSVTFWRQLAARYANRPGVVFNLYNEPHDVPWSCWRNGGCLVTSSTPSPSTGRPVTYKAAGMQTLLDAVRRQGAANLVLVAGLDWGYDLSGVGNGYALHGSNIAYDTHVYTQWHATEDDWDRAFGFLTSRFPVTATEFGSIDCSEDVTRRLLDYFDAPRGVAANRMAWTIWSWNDPGTCSQPSVLADWSGTPLPGQGVLIRDRLLGSPAVAAT
jgi:aryl-phospho-beta-D-glucosidase BglC (GH1 family)